MFIYTKYETISSCPVIDITEEEVKQKREDRKYALPKVNPYKENGPNKKLQKSKVYEIPKVKTREVNQPIVNKDFIKNRPQDKYELPKIGKSKINGLLE